VIHALLPVAMLIGVGYLLRASGFLPEAAWAPIDRLVYFVLFPALLFKELTAADLTGAPVARMTITLLTSQLVMAGLAWTARRRWHLDGPAYTSVLRCLVRWNTYVALALAPGLFGPAAMPLVALAVAVMVLAANVMSVAALSRHGRMGRAGQMAFVQAVATNPLIVACVAGSVLNLAGVGLPALVADSLTILGRATLALDLLTVGAGLRPTRVADRPLVILGTTTAHLLLRPAVGLALALLLGVGGTPLQVVAPACAVPTATSSYILARLLGGDAELMAALVTATTAAALVTLPMVLALARVLG
jgi:malonate transporter